MANHKKMKIGILVLVVLVACILIAVLVQRSRTDGEDKPQEKNELLAADGEMFDYQEAGAVKIPDYRGVEVPVEPDGEDVEIELSSVLDDIERIEEDVVIAKGDYAYIDYTASIGGTEVEDLAEEEVLLVVGEYKYPKNLEDALVGKEIGKTYSIPVSFAADYPDETVAGRTVDFRVTIRAKFDDRYAKAVSKGKYKDVDSYKKSLAKRLRRENMENLPELAWEALMEKCEVMKYPAKLVKEEVDNLNMQYAGFAEVSGVTYEELMESLMMDEATVKETAQEVVRDRMVAKTIAKWENFTWDEQESRKYLLQLMEYDEDDGETLANLTEDYKESYGSRPMDDILVAKAKDLVSKSAVPK